MSPYIETIKLHEGILNNLGFHQQRFERTRSHELGLRKHPKLEEVIQVPDGLHTGLFRCRVIYGKNITRIEFEPYVRPAVRSLKVVISDSISYGYKSADRSALDHLFQLRGECDDILIVKKGCVSDSYYANVAFWDGKHWFTPDTPLLPGTMRASLLTHGFLKARRILAGELEAFQFLRLINAMNDLQEGPEISVDAIVY